MKYTTYGSVRGCCGHRHRTIRAAVLCAANDQESCHDQGGYSDREVVLVGDDGYLYRDLGHVSAEDGDHWIRSPGGVGVMI